MSQKGAKAKSKADSTKAKKPKLTAKQRIAAHVKACQPKPKSAGVGAGRPSVYLREFCSKIIEFMARGYSLTAFAGSIGVSRETIYAWTQTHPEFSDALTKAKAARTLYWEKRLEFAGPDARAVIFALRNSCADEWKNEPDVAVTVNNETTVDLSKPPEEWGQAELEAELLKRGALPARPATNPNHQPQATRPGK